MNSLNDIQLNIQKAQEFHSLYFKQMIENPSISLSLARYKKAIFTTRRVFEKTGIIEACSRCAQRNQGSCCFEGMENNYDTVLLLINLLMGVNLPNERELENHCFFLGKNGCKLLARYYFCVNYFCPELEKSLGKQNMNRLSAVIGNEIFAGWELEVVIHNWLLDKNYPL